MYNENIDINFFFKTLFKEKVFIFFFTILPVLFVFIYQNLKLPKFNSYISMTTKAEELVFEENLNFLIINNKKGYNFDREFKILFFLEIENFDNLRDYIQKKNNNFDKDKYKFNSIKVQKNQFGKGSLIILSFSGKNNKMINNLFIDYLNYYKQISANFYSSQIEEILNNKIIHYAKEVNNAKKMGILNADLNAYKTLGDFSFLGEQLLSIRLDSLKKTKANLDKILENYYDNIKFDVLNSTEAKDSSLRKVIFLTFVISLMLSISIAFLKNEKKIFTNN